MNTQKTDKSDEHLERNGAAPERLERNGALPCSKTSWKERAKLLARLYFVYFKIGSVMFGGGMAMLPILERELIDKRHWTNREELSDYYAISQVTPGIIAVNVATFIGYNLAGVLGGIIATLGVVTPSIIIISILAYFIDSLSDIEWVQAALAGINVAVCCLLTFSLERFVKDGLKACNKIVAIILMISSFVLIAFLHVNSAIVIVVGALIGIIMRVISVHHDKKKNSGGTK